MISKYYFHATIRHTLKVSLIYTKTKTPSGYLSYAHRLIKGLTDKGLEIEVFPIKKHEMSFLGRPLMGNLSQSIGSRFVSPKGDVVHSLTPNVICGKTNFVTLHDLIPLEMANEFSDSLYRKKGNRILYEKVIGIENLIVFSNIMKDSLITRFGLSADNIYVVTQSIDHSEFYRDVVPDLRKEGKKLIVTVGDLNPRKRYDIIFSALGGHEDYEVVHIGATNAWSDRFLSLQSLISRYNNIKMLGPKSLDVVRQYMSSSDLLVHLSESEGFGLTPIEAMACGTNVVVNDLPIFKENLDDKARYASLNEESLMKAVELSLKHPLPIEELVNYTSKFSIEKMADRTMEVYQNALIG